MRKNPLPLLEINNLNVRFHTPEGTVYAVNDISYQVNTAETVAIVGESGCGKSVSVMSVLGLIPQPPGEIPAGTAFFKDQNLLAMSDQELTKFRGDEIGLIFQDPMTSLNPTLSMEKQLVEAIIKHQGATKNSAIEKAVEYLNLVGINDAEQRLGNYPHQFSGGMRQRAMIAMMLALNPTLLIADEPTTALDVTIQAQIIDLAKKIKAETQMSIIWITHDLGVVAELADRVIVMYAGEIMEEANVVSLFHATRHPYTMALLKSLPRVDFRRNTARLESIQGSPPSCYTIINGCPFANRCSYVLAKCWNDKPPLISISQDHQAACWVNIETGDLR
jgi:oligopeptide transport system ATP-binding protein